MLLNQIPTPALVLDLDAFDRNCDRINEMIRGTGMKLRPHYKSSRCTAVAHMQMAKGAKGMTCAKISEAQDLAEAGIEDILIANQIVEKSKIAQAAALANCCRLTVAVDSAANIEDLQFYAAAENSRIFCLVEYEIGMNRCGVSTKEEVLELARQIGSCSNLTFEGIQAYAGHLSHEADLNARKAASDAVEQKLRELKTYLEQQGVEVRTVSGASTGTVQLRPKDSVYTEIQAGSYVFMDVAYGALKLPFEPALTVLSTVISKSKGLTIVDAGRKSVSVDQAMPRFLEFPEIEVKCSEEHSSTLSTELKTAIGEKYRLIPGHCCTAMNLHDRIYFVRGGKVVDKVPVTSRGRSV